MAVTSNVNTRNYAVRFVQPPHHTRRSPPLTVSRELFDGSNGCPARTDERTDELHSRGEVGKIDADQF